MLGCSETHRKARLFCHSATVKHERGNEREEEEEGKMRKQEGGGEEDGEAD